MATTVHEKELKLEVGPDAGLPDLTGLPGVDRVADGVTHELVATYYDTPELRLLAHGVTLRRRTGGTDAGWHLKLPAPDGARDELQEPDGPDVPGSFLRVADLHTRGGRLAPVAELRTTRLVLPLLDADGQTLAEVCDDRVAARAPEPGTLRLTEWREWEVELVDGPDELLDAAAESLRSAGARAGSASKLVRVLGDPRPAPDAPAEERGSTASVVADRLREQVAELEYRDGRVRRDLPDGVHKMRVATRRLRSVLATFRPLLDREQTEPVRDELKWLAGVLGDARDAQVMRRFLVGLLADEPAELVIGPVEARVHDELTSEYRLAHDRAVEALQSPRYHALVDRLEALAADPPWTERAGRPPDKELRSRVRKELRRARSRVETAAEAPDREARDLALHEARKAVKRLRYAAETVGAVHGRKARRLAKATQRVQTLLGDQHDAVTSQPRIRQLGVQAHLSDENAFTYGLLLGRQRAEAAALDEEFERAWDRVERAKVVGWLE